MDAVVLAVAITATTSLIIAGIAFYILYRFMLARRLKKSNTGLSVRRTELRPHGGGLKGVIVDEEGLDVLYLRNLENGHFGACFSKVWYNHMDEEVKRMDSRGEKPCKSEPIQEIPLLQEPKNGYDFEVKESPSPPPPPPPPRGIMLSPPSPPPTPLFQPEAPKSKTPPPLPPPPPPRTPPPAPPRKGNLASASPLGAPRPKPAPPPPPAKTRGSNVSSHKPPIAPKSNENRHSKAEDQSGKSIKENGAGQMKLKPLHWDKVIANADHSMVWNEINDGSFRFDDDQIEVLFGYTPTSHKPSERNNKLSNQGSSNTAAPSAQVFLLDPRKSQNTAIILKSLAITRKEILDCLLEGRGLNVDTLEKLTKMCPTQDEINKILQFDGNPTKLADAESFLYHILKAVPSAFIRCNAMLFRTNYDQEILHLKESLQTLELGCKEIRTRGIFFKLLEAILKAGNRMNAGTTRGNARGFNLTALRRLSDVKSADGKTTLLHFVVEQVVRSEGKRCLINRNCKPDGPVSDHTNKSNEEQDREHVMLGLPVVGSLSTEFNNVKKAAAIEYDSLTTTCSVLTTKVDEIKVLLSRCMDTESSRFVTEMKGFLEDCQEELKVVGDEETRVMELVRKTTVYFQAGDPRDKGVNQLQIFVIVKDFLNMVDQVCAEITRKTQKTKAGSGGSSPPLSPTTRPPVRFQNLELYFRAQRHGTSSSDSENDF